MSRIDRLFICLLIALVIFCFYMNGKWWFFLAGICVSVAFAILMGFWLQGIAKKRNEGEWNTFLDSLEKTNTVNTSQSKKAVETPKDNS